MKRQYISVLLACIIMLTGCAADGSDGESLSGTVLSPTGYPSGEIQRQYVMVNGNSYIGAVGNKTTLPDGYILYGSIATEQNTELPKNDLEGVHVSVGTEVYYNPDETEKVYCKFSDVYVCFELSK